MIAQEPTFAWSPSVSGDSFSKAIRDAYAEIVRWKRNIFLLPSGKEGERFIFELSRLFKAFGEASSLEGIALTAASVMPQLLLQKPHQKSNVKEHIKCLERRMSTWLEGDINTLLLEGRVIQQRIRRQHTKDENETLAKSFTKLMRKGNVKSALRLLSKTQGTLLSVNQPATPDDDGKTVLDILREKHPPACDVSDDILRMWNMSTFRTKR